MAGTSTITKELDKLRTTLFACSSLLTFLGVSTTDEAQAMVFNYEGPVDVPGSTFVLLDVTDQWNSSRTKISRGATDTDGQKNFAHTGQFTVFFQRPINDPYDGEYAGIAVETFLNDAEGVMDEMRGLGWNPNNVLITDTTWQGLWRPTVDEAGVYGDQFQTAWTVAVRRAN